MNTAKGWLVWALAVCCALSAQAAGIFRVDAASTAATPDGQTWATAYPTLQAGTDAASAAGGGEVWVKSGTYTGTTNPVLTMKENVSLYGGFSGTDVFRSLSRLAGAPSIIDGQDVRRCVEGADYATLDGFTITHGFGVEGGGMCAWFVSPTLENCVFAYNRATGFGGAIFTQDASPIVKNCLFWQNSADWQGGAMAYDAVLEYSSPSITNCTFSGNNARFTGGAIHNFDAHTRVTNCVLWGDIARTGSEIHNSETKYPVQVAYSCVQGGYTGTGNIGADPLFVGGGLGGSLQLRSGSPCENTGTASGAPPWDLLGRSRSVTDMGAYEGGVLPANILSLTIQVSSEDAGVTIPSPGTYSHVRGEYVVLTAEPLGMRFAGWTGGLTTTKQTDAVLIDSQKTVTANFSENIVYVNAANTAGPWDGRTWATAFKDIQSGVNLAAAELGGEVWVQAGTYTVPAIDINVLKMKPGVSVCGGFAGMEKDREERNWTANITTISGQDDKRCILGATYATLDGFTVTRGHADSDGTGGMHNYGVSPTVLNCIFEQNQGGMSNSYASPILKNCIFTQNTSGSNGGGIRNDYASPKLTNCTFSGNSAGGGGAIYNNQASPTITNCSFTGNSANSGGAIYNTSASPKITNCILWGDTATSDPEIYGGSTATVTYSCVQGGSPGTGNIDADPRFAASPDNLQLLSDSPCIDMGTTVGAPATDMLGIPRPQGVGLDMGAYEYCPLVPPVVTSASALTNNPQPTWTWTSGSAKGAGYYRCGFTDGTWDLVNDAAVTSFVPGSPLADGPYTLYVQERDRAGNWGPSGSYTVTVDTVIPIGAIVIDGGAALAKILAVTLTLTAADRAGAPVADMHFSNDGAVWSDWEPFAASKAWTLAVGDGLKTVYVQYRYTGGTVSAAVFSDSITLSQDVTAPTGSIVINGGAAYTNVPAVTLSLTANDGTGSGVLYMRFSNDGSGWSGWEQFRSSKAWTFPDGDAPKAVYVQYRDAGDNVSSDTISDSILLNSTVLPPGVLCVDPLSTAAVPDGLLWVTAFTEIQAGIDAASAAGGGEVWVRTGTYTSANSPVLTLESGVAVYGGFAGSEKTREQRNWCANITVIDGENARRCVNGAEGATLDGFHIARGANSGNGGGMYNYHASQTVANCFFTQNTAGGGGGGIYNASASPTLTNCVFTQNKAAYGGAVYLYNSESSITPTMSNCTFTQNSASALGGAIFCSSSYLNVINCILWNDAAPTSPEMSGDSTAAITYSCVQGGSPGTGNIDANPLFVAAPDDVRLQAGSPCRDTGTSAGTPTTDIAGVSRPQGGGVDMGAYEYYGPWVIGGIVINNGAKSTASPEVTLSLNWSTLSGSPVSRMRFSDDGATWSAWEPVAATRAYTLPGPDGYHTVRVQFRDAAGNLSDRLNDYIMLDANPPTGTIVINNGAVSTKNPEVTLSLTWADGTGSGVNRMRFSDNGSTWTAWESLNATKTHTLPLPPGGHQTVRVQYRDSAGNYSSRFNDYIRLDLP